MLERKTVRGEKLVYVPILERDIENLLKHIAKAYDCKVNELGEIDIAGELEMILEAGGVA